MLTFVHIFYVGKSWYLALADSF